MSLHPIKYIFFTCLSLSLLATEFPQTVLLQDINAQLIQFRTNRLKTNEQIECFRKVPIFSTIATQKQPIMLPITHGDFMQFLDFCSKKDESHEALETSFGNIDKGIAVLDALQFPYQKLKRKNEEQTQHSIKKPKEENESTQEKIIFLFPDNSLYPVEGNLALRLKETPNSVLNELYEDFQQPKTLKVTIPFKVEKQIMASFISYWENLDEFILIRDRLTESINQTPSLNFIKEQSDKMKKVYELAHYLELKNLEVQLADALLYSKYLQDVLAIEQLLSTNLPFQELIKKAKNLIALHVVEPQKKYNGSTFTIENKKIESMQTIINSIAILYDFFSDGITFALHHNKKQLALFLFNILQESTDPYFASTSILMQFSDAELPLTTKSLDLRYFIEKLNVVLISIKDVEVVEQYVDSIMQLLTQLGLNEEETEKIKDTVYINWNIILFDNPEVTSFAQNKFKRGFEQHLDNLNKTTGKNYRNYKSAAMHSLTMRIYRMDGSYEVLRKNSFSKQDQLTILTGRFASKLI